MTKEVTLTHVILGFLLLLVVYTIVAAIFKLWPFQSGGKIRRMLDEGDLSRVTTISEKQKCCSYSVWINGEQKNVTVSCKGKRCCDAFTEACGLLTSGSRYSNTNFINDLKSKYPSIDIVIEDVAPKYCGGGIIPEQVPVVANYNLSV